jgi:hypothetical protein
LAWVQTRLPAIKEALRDRYGWTINDSVNPDEAVARGAAVQGARLCGYLREEVKLWDITPLSLGIELANSKMDAIICANEPIPVTKWRKGSQAFTTQRDGQESIRFRIYQGERPIAGDNEFIGEVVLNLATTRPAGEVRVNCMFKVDHDGILHVLAEDISTDGQPVEKTFDRFYRLTQQEVDQKLQEAKVHENEDAVTNRIFQLEEEIIRLQRVINQDKTSDNLLLETLENLKAAINSRDVNQAEELLTELKIYIRPSEEPRQIENIPEQNMGDPRSLRDFIVWGIENYPAENYAVILWNHGTGWKEDDIYAFARSRGVEIQASQDEVRSLTRNNRRLSRAFFLSSITEVLQLDDEDSRAIAFDDSSLDFLDNAKLQQAFQEAEAITGKKVSLIGMDACLMGMVEVAYQLRSNTSPISPAV